MTSAEYDIAIIGGGMVGASLACGLARENVNIALIEERQPESDCQPSYDDRGIALSVSSQRIFDSMGLWSKLAQHVCPIKRVHVSEQGRFGCVRMAAELLGLEALGFVVTARQLGRTLFDEISNHDNIDVICPASATGIRRRSEFVEVEVTRANAGAALACRLLAVADGASSRSRELLGIKARPRDYQQAAIVSNVTVSRDHGCTAYERFTPDGLIALLPLRGKRCVTVLVVPSDRADSYLKAGNDEYIDHLQQRFGKRLGKILEPGARSSYTLRLLELEPGQQARDRVVLLGNAAYTVHANGAQGFNLALRGVAGLVEHIAAALHDGKEIGSENLLSAYVLSRKTDQRRVIRFTDTLHHVFNGTNPLKSVVRNTAMGLLDVASPLKKEFIRRATGLHADQSVFTRSNPWFPSSAEPRHCVSALKDRLREASCSWLTNG